MHAGLGRSVVLDSALPNVFANMVYRGRAVVQQGWVMHGALPVTEGTRWMAAIFYQPPHGGEAEGHGS